MKPNINVPITKEQWLEKSPKQKWAYRVKLVKYKKGKRMDCLRCCGGTWDLSTVNVRFIKLGKCTRCNGTGVPTKSQCRMCAGEKESCKGGCAKTKEAEEKQRAENKMVIQKLLGDITTFTGQEHLREIWKHIAARMRKEKTKGEKLSAIRLQLVKKIFEKVKPQIDEVKKYLNTEVNRVTRLLKEQKESQANQTPLCLRGRWF
jgi:hypothetical protein